MTGADGSEDNLHALIRIAGLTIAIATRHVREAVPAPAVLVPFPALMPGIVGALELRGQLIPVLDLGAPLGRMSTDEGNQIVIVLRVSDRVIGVMAEQIEGVCALPDDNISPLFGAGESPIKASFTLPEHRGNVLDCAKLMALPGLPLSEDRTGQRMAASVNLVPTLLFTLAGRPFALSSNNVDAAVPWQELLPAAIEDPLWVGMVPYRGVEIPVIDTLMLLNQGAIEPGRRAGAAIVLKATPADGGREQRLGYVALLIDQVDNFIRLDPGVILPAERNGSFGSDLICGLIDRADGSRLLIDGEGLVCDPRIGSFSAIQQGAASDGTSLRGEHLPVSAEAASNVESKPFLIFEAEGTAHALALDDVEEILNGSSGQVAAVPVAGGMADVFAHRGRALSLIDMAGKSGESDGFVIVLRGTADRPCTGIRVNTIRSVERAVRRKVGKGEMPLPSGAPAEVIGLGGKNACPVLDLRRLLA